jgi:3'-5' exoribonuclease
MQKIFISEFTPNQTVSTTFLVKTKELRSKKTGGQFALITLTDRTGDIVGQWWDNFEDVIDTFDRDDFVFARGLVNVYRNQLQLSLHRVRKCNDHEIDPSHYFPTTKYNVDEMFSELMAIVRDFQNPHLKQLLENIFADDATVRKFKRAPAAKTMHHPYLGGLLEHTLSLLKLARKVGGHYLGIDLDLLQTGAVLHDFGKIDELSYERGFGYTNEGQMIGHLTMETIMVHDHIRNIPDFPDELRRHLLHLLLSHHGKLEYGSPKLPLTPEALMLSYLDDLDSKVEAMQRLINEPHAHGDWTRMTAMFERPIYRVRTIEPPPAETPVPLAQQVQAATATNATTNNVPANNTGNTGGQSPRKSPVRADSFNTPFEHLAEMFKE